MLNSFLLVSSSIWAFETTKIMYFHQCYSSIPRKKSNELIIIAVDVGSQNFVSKFLKNFFISRDVKSRIFNETNLDYFDQLIRKSSRLRNWFWFRCHKTNCDVTIVLKNGKRSSNRHFYFILDSGWCRTTLGSAEGSESRCYILVIDKRL